MPLPTSFGQDGISSLCVTPVDNFRPMHFFQIESGWKRELAIMCNLNFLLANKHSARP